MSVTAILTDEAGRPIPKPVRGDFVSPVDFVRAVHTYNDRIAAIANKSFAKAFRASLTSLLRKKTK